MANLKGGTTIGGHKVWHAGNDGTGSGLGADTLDGLHSGDFLGIAAKAADSDKLDNLNSTQFLRSDTPATFTSDWFRFNAQVQIDTDNGNDKFYITKIGDVSESLQMWTDDYISYLKAVQDETGRGSIYFQAEESGSANSAFQFNVNQEVSPLESFTIYGDGQAKFGNTITLPSAILPSIGEVINIGEGHAEIDGSDAWIYMGTDGYGWNLKYVGSTAGNDGNEFRIESDNITGRYIQMDHDGNFEHYDGSTIAKIWHGNNDGTGSGLDADLLDGQHGSYYETAFSKNTGFNKNFGTTIGTVAQGNDSRFTDARTPLAHTITSHSDTTVTGAELNDDHSKLAGIDTGATDDQTAAEILTAIKTVDGTGSGLDADTLDGEGSSNFLSSYQSDIYLGGTLRIYNTNDHEISQTGEEYGVQCYQAISGKDAFMSFNIVGDYAVHFGLDGTTNDLAVGGWSMGAVKHRIWHAGNDGTGSGLDADKLDGQEYVNMVIDWENYADSAVSTHTALGDAHHAESHTVVSHSDTTVTGAELNADHSKLAGIDTGATDDLTAAEILTAIKTVDGTGSGLDADLLDGINGASYLRSDITSTFTAAQLTLDTKVVIDCAEATQPFCITRIGSVNESMQMWTDDTYSYILAHQDAVGNGRLRFRAEESGPDNAAFSFVVDDEGTPDDAFIIYGAGNAKFYKSVGIGNTIPGGSFNNGKAIAIGDSDTGIRQNGDGVLELWANNQEIAQFTSSQVDLYKPLKLLSGAAINEFSIDGTLAGDSDTAVPTEQAVKEYVDASVPTAAEILTAIKTVDGTGSGLDADLLDGTELAALLKLSGGTMAGLIDLAGYALRLNGANTYIDENTGDMELHVAVGKSVKIVVG